MALPIPVDSPAKAVRAKATRTLSFTTRYCSLCCEPGPVGNRTTAVGAVLNGVATYNVNYICPMLKITIPGFRETNLTDLILDYNGTLARDGELIIGVTADRLHELSESLRIHILTDDTFGKAADEVADLPCELSVLGPGDQAQAKLDYVNKVGAAGAVSIGNGKGIV